MSGEHGDSGKDNLAYVSPAEERLQNPPTPTDIDQHDYDQHTAKINEAQRTNKAANRESERGAGRTRRR
jgi:hypothetical protein